MAFKRKTSPAEYSQAAEHIDHPGTVIEVGIGYDNLVDKTTEVNLKSKEQATKGIDLISKGTIAKSRSEKLLFEAKDLANKGEELKMKGTAVLADAKHLLEISNEEKAQANALLHEVQIVFKKYADLKNKMDLLAENSDKNLQASNLKHREGLEFVERGKNLLIKANSMLEEASELNDDANKQIVDGNRLLEEAKVITNSTLREIGDYTKDHYTMEKLITAHEEVVETPVVKTSKRK